MDLTPAPRPKVALFVTCLVDLFRPVIGFATVKLLENAGCDVVVPRAQTCCGQPAWNNGDRKNAKDIAQQLITTFETYDYVVMPSGSCAGMLCQHYVELFSGDGTWQERAMNLAAKTHELVSFLTDIMGLKRVECAFNGTVTYHDSCAGLRELGIQAQPRKLLASIEGLKLTEMKECDICCGFGGTFSVKYPDISNAIVSAKTANIADSGANVLLGGDLGCLLNIAGKLSREGSKVEVRHVAEILADMTDEAPIAMGKNAMGKNAVKSKLPSWK